MKPPASPAAGIGSIQTALVIDDQADVCSLVVSLLGRLGLEAAGVSSKRDLLAALATGHPDLIMLDLSLGETDAVEIFGLLKGSRSRAILISGHSQRVLEHSRRIGERAGIEIIGVLRKPLRQHDLRALLVNLGNSSNSGDPKPAVEANPGLLTQALNMGWMEIWYQPKVDLCAETVTGAECLARLRHPQRGVLPPAAFLEPASARDLYELTLQAARESIRCARNMAEQGRQFRFSINVAGRTIIRPGLLDELRVLREGHPNAPPMILELTETDVAGNSDAAQEFATRAVLHGFELSIDDFGTGYATFERLRNIPFTELKLDRSLVHGCSRDAELRSICRAAVKLAHDFEAKAVAEGVEDAEDLETVRALGFDLAQGYLFAPPLPASQFLNRIGGELPRVWSARSRDKALRRQI